LRKFISKITRENDWSVAQEIDICFASSKTSIQTPIPTKKKKREREKLKKGEIYFCSCVIGFSP
jgi:hypothetical protein